MIGRTDVRAAWNVALLTKLGPVVELAIVGVFVGVTRNAIARLIVLERLLRRFCSPLGFDSMTFLAG